jgi:hypothetical protein
MFRFACKRIPFSVLLLTALLSGFSAGPVVELTEGDAPGSEIEEVILRRRKSEGLASNPIDDSSARVYHKTLPFSLRLPAHQGFGDSARNGIGAPLTL